MRAALAHAQKISRMHGLVASYDPGTYSVKVMLQPSGKLTGWIPIETEAIGNGWGIACGPNIGDQARIDFADGDPEAGAVTGFIYSDADRPPPAPCGEFWTVHKSGSLLKFHNDGTVEITANSTMTYTATQHHFVGPVQMDSTLNVTDTISGEGGMLISGDNGSGHASTVTGNTNFVGGVTANGHDIGSTHQHVNSGGSGLGGVPQ
ncbi:phage baseplate assembly protein V [Burkholderia ambifaria]|uniref:phage baseplate assembly protein V n=1 Tax=Burkholderia ambifaria TaxID=152480 RepID=UPI001B991BF7|nr:phage baseplate assembly protein V [Burkholderia ambifaria]MBR8182086.1 phage baseplate assembly protein V [Burkholderia ambifaria]